MEKGYCTGSKNCTHKALDRQTSDMICFVCGLVLGSQKMDGVSQYKNFANEFGEVDLACVGGSRKKTCDTNDLSISSLSCQKNTCVTNLDCSLKFAFKTMAIMSEKLALAAKISDRANEIYKKLGERRYSRGINQKAIMATCLYIACRQENKPHTIREICSIARDVSRREIGRAKEYILKQLDLEMGKYVHARDFMTRFCSNLGMKDQAIKIAQEAIQKLEELDIRRSPASIAATIIYIVTQFSDEKKAIKDIVLATRVSEHTIKSSYKDLHPHLSKIIHSWFA